MQRRDVVGTEFLAILFPCALPYFLTSQDKSNRPLKFLLNNHCKHYFQQETRCNMHTMMKFSYKDLKVLT